IRLHFRVGLRGSDRARLHPGVALPRATVAQQVVLERGEAGDERSALTERAQAHVDAEDETVDRARIEQADQRLAEPREKFLIRDRACAIRIAELRKEEHEVDVRGEIE